MTHRPALTVLLLSDDRPGHYHLAEGVVAALGRVADVEVTRLTIARRAALPGRVLRWLIARGRASPGFVLGAGYGLKAGDLGTADIVVSAGGETMAANAAAARALGAANIFCGSLRSMPPDHFSLIVTSYARFAHLPRHLVALKPSALDADDLGRPDVVPQFGPDNPPARAALLVGGDSGLFRYERGEWRRVLRLMDEIAGAWGTRWLVSTSRRTDDWLGDAIADMARESGIIERFVDYRTAGPSTLGEILRAADIVVCSEDSSTMISEAISARLPVVGVAPRHHSFKPEEAEYRRYLIAQGWCRGVEIAALDVARFGAALAEVAPLGENPLDKLAADLKAGLPARFWTHAGEGS